MAYLRLVRPMSICNRAVFALAIALLSGCAGEPVASTASAHPRVIGKVKSISSEDLRIILELERDGILKEFHSLPTSVTVEVVNHNYVSISFTVRGQQCGDAVYRIRGKWTRPNLPRATIEA